jgi:PKD repeat protein
VYEVILQASTPIGVITSGHMVTIVAQPIARFSVSDPMPAAGHSVNFVNESGGRQPLSYLWDFGDGTASSEVSPSHIYHASGQHAVRLVVSGPDGASESMQTVVVGQAPVADFVISESADAGSVIQAQAFSDDSATDIKWDMGDGQSHEGNLIEHVYWSAGDYVITATITNAFGETVIQRGIRINPGPLYLYLPLIENAVDVVSGVQITVEPEPQGDPSVQIDAVRTKDELALLELPENLRPVDQLLAYINEARRVNGLLPLNHVHELSVAAQTHADDMALVDFTGHTGSDGSVPALRVQLSGYPGGYAGEATAWGMPTALEPVRYWLASPAHRDIILNPAAADVGVGFSENYAAANVWYWAAEFASLDLPVVHVSLPASAGASPPPEPVIDLLGPPRDSAFLLTPDTNLIFTWSWPLPLTPDERFAIYVNSRGRTTQLGTVTQSGTENQYQFLISAANVPVAPGQQQWFVQLEDMLQGSMRDQSESWPINFLSEPE